ncbi:helix-turn-helix domain-containing protein [Paraburkholderia hospita]|uniref:helix-turn-helix domain-containing protein n=1 Tax=Paraburkholderia hospita TaxID=169430 RepID=UPI0009A6F57E|nr:helix-turn-helix transcriptional regulator [Paraburkholderia hospita]AXF02697.1 helix-turn-helix domain-containing protein [Paraburkholderia hospita]OUL96305.1 transcriptional regulator [Paraburkholderia hospita]SKC91542.1 DNA-binding transcriptional regulator, XRE-family HTH domain [Burkholderia sp. CF099]
MDYSVKTLSQLRPVLRGFRKAAGLTQAMIAERLGITQQSYAQFEADPAAAGVERLFKVLRLLNAGITLSQDEPSPANAAPVAKMASSNRLAAPGRNAPKTAPRKRAANPATERDAPALKAEKRAPTGAAAQGTRQAPRKPAATPDGRASARAPRTASAPKKREQW